MSKNEFHDPDIIYLDEETEKKEKTEKPKRVRKKKTSVPNWKKYGLPAGAVLGVLVLLYVGVTVYFMGHFFVNTRMGGYDLSGKSASDAEDF